MTQRIEEIGGQTLVCGEALQFMQTLPDSSVDLLCTDPPYYRVKNLPWDRQWDKPQEFIAWIGRLCEEWRRVLKPNGSLYVFASRKMASRVELEVERHFSVVNHITWAKPAFSTKAEMFRKDDLRSYFPVAEDIIFAEQFGADSSAKGEAGYGAACDELRGFVFEPLRSYLDGERERCGLNKPQVDAAWCEFKQVAMTAQSQKWFSTSCWNLPTAEAYGWLRTLFNERGNGSGPYLRREYEDLRREYEDLRREYEDLRRPFAVTADVPYTDVWDFPTVNAYPGKHPCEKPLAMMEHIIRTSSREGAVVLDCFMGSGVTLEACRNLGRNGIGVDLDEHWWGEACRRVEQAVQQRQDAEAQLTLEGLAGRDGA